MTQLIIILLLVLVLFLAFLAWRYWQQTGALQKRYAPVITIQTEVTTLQAKLEQAKQNQKNFEADNQQRRAKLIQDSEQAQAKYTELNKEISLLEENLEDISFGLYKPHFDFQTSEEYKTALEALREKEKQFLHEGKAAISGVKWTVSNSAKEGERMQKQYTKLMLRAFNGECDAAVANVTWNNIAKMEERVRKSWEVLNQLGSVMQFSLTAEYLQLKLNELRLTHEYQEKRNQEREEQRRIREQIRDEEKAQKDMDKAREDAEHQEAEYEKALSKAREEALQATGSQLEKLTTR